MSARKVYKPRKYASKKKKTGVPKATRTYVKRALSSAKETNHRLIDNSAQNLGYDFPLLAQWSSIPLGDSITEREGDRIQPIKAELIFRIQLRALTQVARIILFQWRMDTADSTPTFADLLQVPNASNSYLSPYVTDTAKRSQFHVLKDMTFSNTNGEVSQLFVRKVNITKFMNKYITYNRGVTTGRSQIFVFAFSNVLAGGTPAGPEFDKIYHLYFKDS